MVNVVTLDKDTISDFLKDNVISLVGFWAAWCGPCKMMSPVLSDLASKYRGEYGVGKVNVDDCSEIAEKYGIENLPTLIIFKHGKEVSRVIGYMNLDDLKKEILKSLF